MLPIVHGRGWHTRHSGRSTKLTAALYIQKSLSKRKNSRKLLGTFAYSLITDLISPGGYVDPDVADCTWTRLAYAPLRTQHKA